MASWAVRGLQLLVRGLPDRMLWVTAKALGGVFYYVVRLRRRVVLDRIALVLTSDEKHRVARDSYTYAALSLLWFLRLENVANPQSLISLDGDTRVSLQSMKMAMSGAQSSHAIIMTGHVGALLLINSPKMID
ncbi:Hypothetical protein PHPALM_37502 [Phytophthora palmivora]|uniref:Uncharacterized protein n=1 Tax=Phytophthora palmivora TaxID=4796 RepID=A0A2P4WXA3_9STRA|nr:Hypothetical protein PHPALM_37502 [Phytophthora palmivora]